MSICMYVGFFQLVRHFVHFVLMIFFFFLIVFHYAMECLFYGSQIISVCAHTVQDMTVLFCAYIV